MPGVSDMIGKLDAAAVQAKKEAAERRARGTSFSSSRRLRLTYHFVAIRNSMASYVCVLLADCCYTRC